MELNMAGEALGIGATSFIVSREKMPSFVTEWATVSLIYSALLTVAAGTLAGVTSMKHGRERRVEKLRVARDGIRERAHSAMASPIARNGAFDLVHPHARDPKVVGRVREMAEEFTDLTMTAALWTTKAALDPDIKRESLESLHGPRWFPNPLNVTEADAQRSGGKAGQMERPEFAGFEWSLQDVQETVDLWRAGDCPNMELLRFQALQRWTDSTLKQVARSLPTSSDRTFVAYGRQPSQPDLNALSL
jgi:hypothetical protein